MALKPNDYDRRYIPTKSIRHGPGPSSVLDRLVSVLIYGPLLKWTADFQYEWGMWIQRIIFIIEF